jgi:hypothetical protein
MDTATDRTGDKLVTTDATILASSTETPVPSRTFLIVTTEHLVEVTDSAALRTAAEQHWDEDEDPEVDRELATGTDGNALIELFGLDSEDPDPCCVPGIDLIASERSTSEIVASNADEAAGIMWWERDDPEGIAERANAGAQALRLYPGRDGEPTVDTCYLVADLSDAIRRMELIRDGAWMVPALRASISPDDLTALGRRVQALTRTLAKLTFERR